MRYQLETSKDGLIYNRVKFAKASKLLLLEYHIGVAIEQMADGTIKDWHVHDNDKEFVIQKEQVFIALENARKKG